MRAASKFVAIGKGHFLLVSPAAQGEPWSPNLYHQYVPKVVASPRLSASCQFVWRRRAPHGGTLGGRESCIDVSELWFGALMLRARRVSAHPTPIKAPRGHNWRPVLRLPSTQFVHPHSQAGFSRSLLKARQPPSSMK